MPDVSHQLEVEAPLAATWDFLKDMNNWAELMPGFQGMRVISDTESEWKIKGDVGILTKLVTLDVRITEWVDHDHVSFDFQVREEPLKAQGMLKADEVSEAVTLLTLNLDAQASGMLGPVVNALLSTVMPKMARDFAASIKRETEARWREAGAAV